MFIIFGSPRSGTTLLASALDQNDRIAVPDETDFIIPMAFIIDRVRDPVRGRALITEMIVGTQRFGHSLGYYVSPGDVAAAVAKAAYTVPSMLEAIYAKVAHAAEAKIAGDKSPNDIAFSRVLLKNGLAKSRIKVIHIVRDLRDVLLSLRDSQPSAWPDISAYFPRMWSQSNLMLRDSYSKTTGHYTLVRYEAFVADPSRTLRRLSKFLGVPFQDKMLDPSARAVRYKGQAHHRNLALDIRQRRGNWREALPKPIRTRCAVQAREALEVFGYPLK